MLETTATFPTRPDQLLKPFSKPSVTNGEELVDELGVGVVVEGAGTDAGAGDDESVSVPSLTSSMNIELVDDQPLPYIIPTEALEMLFPIVFMLVCLRSVSSAPLIYTRISPLLELPHLTCICTLYHVFALGFVIIFENECELPLIPTQYIFPPMLHKPTVYNQFQFRCMNPPTTISVPEVYILESNLT